MKQSKLQRLCSVVLKDDSKTSSTLLHLNVEILLKNKYIT